MSEKFLRSLGNIPDEFIQEAMFAEAVPKPKKRIRWIPVVASMAVVLIVVSVTIGIHKSKDADKSTLNYVDGTLGDTYPEGVGAGAPTVYYRGNLYCYHGEYVEQLPEGYEYVGDTHFLGVHECEFYGDLQANFPGNIYVDKFYPEVVYAWSSYGANVYWKMILEDVTNE